MLLCEECESDWFFFLLVWKVKREILVEVLTKRKTVTANDKLILPYSLSEVSQERPQGAWNPCPLLLCAAAAAAVCSHLEREAWAWKGNAGFASQVGNLWVALLSARRGRGLNKALKMVWSAGNNSSWFHGQVPVQCSVWLDRSAHQPCAPQQEGHGGVCYGELLSRARLRIIEEFSWKSPFRASNSTLL